MLVSVQKCPQMRVYRIFVCSRKGANILIINNNCSEMPKKEAK